MGKKMNYDGMYDWRELPEPPDVNKDNITPEPPEEFERRRDLDFGRLMIKIIRKCYTVKGDDD